MNLISRILFVFIAKFALTEAGVRPTECQMWQNMVMTTQAQKFLNVTCAANNLCTGFSCYGSLLFVISSINGMEPFGFSLEFIPCSYPLVLRIRLNSSDVEFMKLLGVHGRNQESIVLLTPDDDGNDKSYGRLNVAWNAILKPVKYFVALEVNFTRIFMNGEFPPVPLVPHQDFPVPNCQYGPMSTLPRKPKEKEQEEMDSIDCEGNMCTTQSQNSILHKFGEHVDSGLIVKVAVGAGSLLLTLCILVGILFARRHRRSLKLQKLRVDNDLKGESEEEDGRGEEDESPPSTGRGYPDDKRKLLLV